MAEPKHAIPASISIAVVALRPELDGPARSRFVAMSERYPFGLDANRPDAVVRRGPEWATMQGCPTSISFELPPTMPSSSAP